MTVVSGFPWKRGTGDVRRTFRKRNGTTLTNLDPIDDVGSHADEDIVPDSAFASDVTPGLPGTYRALATSPRDVASRAAKAICDGGRGVGSSGLGVYLDFAAAIERVGEKTIRERYGNLFDMYSRITDEDPCNRKS